MACFFMLSLLTDKSEARDFFAKFTHKQKGGL